MKRFLGDDFLLDSNVAIDLYETFARREWPGEDPVGKQFTTPNTSGPIAKFQLRPTPVTSRT